MTHPHPGPVGAGARLVWRRQRVLWWIYAVNLVLAGLGTLPMAMRTGTILNHSLAARPLVKGMDVTVLGSLAMHPSRPFLAPGTGIAAFVFFIFMLFVTGGVLKVYVLDRRLTTEEFFQACGAFFWRFFRLLIILLLMLAPIAALASALLRWSDKLSSDAAPALLGFWVEVASLLVIGLLLMILRLWFDLAELHAVVENEPAVRRSLAAAFRLLERNFASLFWLYFRISLATWMVLALALGVWIRLVPADAVSTSFAIGQVVAVFWIAARLWQRASEACWYQQRGPVPAAEPNTFSPPPLRPHWTAAPSIPLLFRRFLTWPPR
jgi:hypothetical protein